MKPKIRIVDNTFTPFVKSASMREGNTAVPPSNFEWASPDDVNVKNGVVFYTDGSMRLVSKSFADKAIAWLVEPKCLRPENYEFAKIHHESFKTVLTYDQDTLFSIPNGRFYPFGGSSIPLNEWRIYEKTKNVCMIVSNKTATEGHKLRHEIVRKFGFSKFGQSVDVYGVSAGRPFENKLDILKDYRFCIVVESGRFNWYFTEKLIDCFAVGTVPIYWGCPDIKRFFDVEGIVPFENIHDLQQVLRVLYYSDYKKAIKRNLRAAKHYCICEDWFVDLVKG